jgi:hypothetical protein
MGPPMGNRWGGDAWKNASKSASDRNLRESGGPQRPRCDLTWASHVTREPLMCCLGRVPSAGHSLSRSRPLTRLPATIVSTFSRLSARLRRHAASRCSPIFFGWVTEGRKTRWCLRALTRRRWVLWIDGRWSALRLTH